MMMHTVGRHMNEQCCKRFSVLGKLYESDSLDRHMKTNEKRHMELRSIPGMCVIKSGSGICLIFIEAMFIFFIKSGTIH